MSVIFKEYYKYNRNRNVVTYYVKNNLFLFSIVVFLYFTVNFNSHINYGMWRIDGMIFREGIGFSHPNQAMLIWLGCALGILSFANQKGAIKTFLAVTIPTIAVFHYTQSRTATLVIIALCFLVLIFNKTLNKPLTKLESIAISLYPTILSVFSIALVYLPYRPEIDAIFSGRIKLYKEFYYRSDLSLFGDSALESAMIDNSYIHGILTKGVLFFLVYLFIFFILLRSNKYMTRNDAIVIIGFFTVGLAKTMLFRLDLLILVILVIYRNQETRLKNNDECKKITTD